MRNGIGISLLLLLASCKTYQLTPASFKEQITQTKAFQLKDQAPSYLASKMDAIHCTDKKGNDVVLQNSPSLEMKVINKSGRTAHFYLNTVVFQDDSLSGGKSRFLPGIAQTIPLDSIARIEVQNGGKKFR